ncbi:MAG: universal stress protein [Bacteroidia bacterium]|nr:universal stress protein [Bacteroidia bacterium]
MKKDEFKIITLINIADSSKHLMENTIGLAKMFDATVELFYVMKPLDVVGAESQLSAMRNINEKYIKAENKLKKLAKSLSKEHGISVSYAYVIGHIKNEILSKLNKTNADLVIMGKRKSKRLKLVSNNISEFIIKQYNGSVIIASDGNSINPEADLKLGMFNSTVDYSTLKCMDKFIYHSTKPIVTFNVSSKQGKPKANDTTAPANKVVEYTFEKNDNTMSNIRSYINKSAVNVLCLKRDEDKKFALSLNKMLDKVDVSLMISDTV